VHAYGHLQRPRATFVKRYVFPDADLVTIADHVRAAEEVGFEVRDLESLREHYVLTTRAWLRRLEERCGEARALVGETRYRIFRLYLAGSAAGFASGRLSIHQMLLLKSDEGAGRLPLTRRRFPRGR
jgi:cyclopropane-fatty-acyl-phospholipid synthase